MIQIIAGEKGKGKTKILLDKANAEVLTTTGTLAFIDKNNRHMYELNNKLIYYFCHKVRKTENN